MLIHDGNPKYIFVAVPKTGTTSIHTFLENHHVMPHLTKKSCKWLSRDYHLGIKEIFEQYRVNRKETFYKFAFHRNPWDRMVSFYTDYSTDPLHLDWSKGLLKYKTFEEFVMDFPNSEWRHHKNFKPTTEYTHHDGIQLVDKIYMYDNFRSEMIQLLQKFGIDRHLFHQGTRLRKAPREKDYKSYYTTTAMKDIVAEVFQQDINLFGDKFD